MGFGVSLILMAVGAVLTWAVHTNGNGSIDVNTVGVILMVVGAVGFLLSLAFWSTWWGPGYFSRGPATAGGPARRRYVRAPREEVIEEEDVY
jgi:hypothetical protein